MSDSPKSENFPTRFSTPDNRLDDHRNQPESLPRAESISSNIGHHNARRATRRSTGGGELPSLLLSVPESQYHGTIARDFEHAIEDDDKSDDGSVKGRLGGRRTSLVSPTGGGSRHNTFSRRDRRPSTVTSRSVSPPNSVEAFAERRRRPRRGTFETVNSKAASFVSLHHTRSNGSVRRGPFPEESLKDDGDVSSSDQGSVEDDVCFPQQDVPSNPHEIDFDDLHEFVASRQKQSTPFVHPFADKHATSAQAQQMKIYEDLKARTSIQSLPRIVSQPSVEKNESDLVDGHASSDLDEKEIDLQKFNSKHPAQHPGREQINRWSFFSSALEETIHAPELGDLLMPDETFQHLFELGPEGGVWWLDMLMPSEEEVEVICKAFNVHGLTREDIITQETREKVELFKSYYFVCFRSFYQMDKQSEYYMEPVNVYAIVFREGILTFTFCPSPHAANVRKRMGKLRDYVALGSDWICYALIDDIVDSFQPVIQVVEEESETIEDGIFIARAEDSRIVLRQIGECRKKIMSLNRLLGGKADVIKGFAKRCNEQFSIAPRQDVGMYLSDIQDHVVTMMSNLGHFEKMLSRSHTNYLAQINVDNIAQGNRANEALSKVTFIATILVPLNLVCGLFGMNVPVPGRDSTGLEWFFGIVGVLLFIMLTSVIIAKKRRFI